MKNLILILTVLALSACGSPADSATLGDSSRGCGGWGGVPCPETKILEQCSSVANTETDHDKYVAYDGQLYGCYLIEIPQ